MANEKPPVIDSLTKENFWNEMYTKYPGEMQHFCEWIDEYKKRVNWCTLFKCGSHEKPPKYHDLPIAMQVGIFIQFVAEAGCRYGIEIDVESKDDFYNIPQKVIHEFFFHEYDNVKNEKYQQ